MPNGEYVCEVCKRLEKEPFTTPNDPIGIELMKAHIADHRKNDEVR